MDLSINDLLYALLTVVVPVALKLLWQYVAERVSNSKYAEAINCVFAAVDYTNQVFVDSLKSSGSFDAKAQEEAFFKAKETALDIMEAGTIKWLQKTFGSIDYWLEVQIEAAVKEGKR